MVLMVLLAAYSGWRMTRRAATPMSETGAYTAILPTTSAVAVEAVIEASQETDSSGDAAAATN
jgi:hypothetical protein